MVAIVKYPNIVEIQCLKVSIYGIVSTVWSLCHNKMQES